MPRRKGEESADQRADAGRDGRGRRERALLPRVRNAAKWVKGFPARTPARPDLNRLPREISD